MVWAVATVRIKDKKAATIGTRGNFIVPIHNTQTMEGRC